MVASELNHQIRLSLMLKRPLTHFWTPPFNVQVIDNEQVYIHSINSIAYL